VNPVTGEVRSVYASDQEVDGYAQVPCGNRRAEVCEPCSTRYAGDAWQLIHAGLAGGKGIPQAVAQHASTFGTFTAPSFGPVHGVRDKGPCRARRDKPVCSHGRPLWCNKRHLDGDERVGTPLCVDCYDYLGHVLWQWHAPELWRRTTIALQRELARRCGLSVKAFSRAAKVSYSKIAEFQARRLVHLHVPIRIDGAGGPDGPAPDLPMSTADLEDAVHAAAAHAFVDTTPLSDGTVYRVRWGTQVDTRTITDRAPLDTPSRASRTAAVHPEQVASYLAKYLTKTTTDFGLHGRVLSAAHARAMGASMHAVLILRTAQDLAGEHEDYHLLLKHLATLGYRGHPLTKSRAYSVTFGQLRRARRRWHRNPARLDPEADIREVLDDDSVPDGFVLVSSWVFDGQGYLDLDQAAAAVEAAARARTR
jgi:hypothetical protein